MNDKVAMNLKVSVVTRALIAECARIDHRTVSAYVEAMVEADAKTKKVTVDDLVVKAKKVAPLPTVDAEQELPDYIDKEVWADWCAHRASIKKPLSASSIKYSIREMEKAHANGWDVNELLTEALAKQWQGFVFDKHCNCRAESDTNNGIDEDELKRQAFFDNSYKALAFFDTKGYVTQEVYLHFLEVMKDTNQLVDPSIVKDMFIMFKRLDKGKEWNDSILQRAIDTGYILNKSGRFDVLRSEERI